MSELLDSALIAVGTEGLAWVDSQQAEREQKLRLRAAVRKAHKAGASEYLLAQYAGVTRQTIRAWLGK